MSIGTHKLISKKKKNSLISQTESEKDKDTKEENVGGSGGNNDDNKDAEANENVASNNTVTVNPILNNVRVESKDDNNSNASQSGGLRP